MLLSFTFEIGKCKNKFKMLQPICLWKDLFECFSKMQACILPIVNRFRDKRRKTSTRKAKLLHHSRAYFVWPLTVWSPPFSVHNNSRKGANIIFPQKKSH